MALIRPRELPRHWKWRLRVRVHATGEPLARSDEAELAFVEAWYAPGTRLGQLTAAGRQRTHRDCPGKGHQRSAETADLHANDICVCNSSGCHIWLPRLTTLESGVLELRSITRPVFLWQIPRELAHVMRLAPQFSDPTSAAYIDESWESWYDQQLAVRGKTPKKRTLRSGFDRSPAPHLHSPPNPGVTLGEAQFHLDHTFPNSE